MVVAVLGALPGAPLVAAARAAVAMTHGGSPTPGVGTAGEARRVLPLPALLAPPGAVGAVGAEVVLPDLPAVTLTAVRPSRLP